MKIVRNILGVDIEIELTSDEVYQAYLEHEEVCDIQDVQDRLENYQGEDDEFLVKYGVELNRVAKDADLIYSIALAKRRNIDKYDTDWEAALDAALKDCLIGLDG